MRTLLLALATSAALVSGASAVSAMPTNALAGADAAPELLLVAQGCGPGFRRGPYGGCRPFGRFRPRFERECFVRRTPYGVRRVCR